jgi:hypothetical protein
MTAIRQTASHGREAGSGRNDANIHQCPGDASIRRLSGVSRCPLPQWLGMSSPRILRRSILGKWTTAVLLVGSRPRVRSAGLHHTSRLEITACGNIPVAHPEHFRSAVLVFDPRA